MVISIRNRVAVWLVSALFCCAAGAAEVEQALLPENFHVVDAVRGIWRSGQPSREEFDTLAKRGLKSTLNLRRHHSDQSKLKGMPIVEFRLAVNAGDLTRADLLRAVRIVRDAPKPILIHCWHGSDRTGTVVAACRIVFSGWSVEKALAELRKSEYGHHALIYRNLPKLLESIDWEEFRRELEALPVQERDSERRGNSNRIDSRRNTASMYGYQRYARISNAVTGGVRFRVTPTAPSTCAP